MNNFLLKDVLFIMILDYFQLSTGDGKSVPIPSSMSSSFQMLKFSYFVGAHIDKSFLHFQKSISSLVSLSLLMISLFTLRCNFELHFL